MRYRKLDANGDSTFGSGFTTFLINTPETVAQAVKTRLLLLTNEWFLDTSEGTPYATNILGKGTETLYDLAIQERIFKTEGVNTILSYSSNLSAQRSLTVEATIDTIYGQTTISMAL